MVVVVDRSCLTPVPWFGQRTAAFTGNGDGGRHPLGGPRRTHRAQACAVCGCGFIPVLRVSNVWRNAWRVERVGKRF